METRILISLTLDELRELITTSVKQALDDRETSRKLSAAPEQWLTREETAELLHVALATLREYEKRKALCPNRIGRRVLYSRSEVERVLRGEKSIGRRRN